MNKLLFLSILLLTCVTGWANGIRNFYVVLLAIVKLLMVVWNLHLKVWML